MHSIFSDGTHTPEELIDIAVSAGLSGVSLTDHDTVAGVERFLAAARAADLPALTGIEISTSFNGGEMHLLGYGMDTRDPDFLSALTRLQRVRQERNEALLERLRELGMPVREEDVGNLAGDRVIGRPHIAQAMVHAGYVSNTRAAFDRYLGKNGTAYVARRALTPAEGIALIRQADGIPVVAHPFTLELKSAALHTCLAELKEVGLMGLEVYYTQHQPEQVHAYLELAESLGLLATGGSDFHGARTPDIQMGKGYGSVRVPDDLFQALTLRNTKPRKNNAGVRIQKGDRKHVQ